MLLKIPRKQIEQMHRRPRPLEYPMRPIRIFHHLKRLPRRDQRIDELLRALEVNIIIPRAVHDQQIATKSAHEIHG